jgi:ATP-dependent DNA helicase RecG
VADRRPITPDDPVVALPGAGPVTAERLATRGLVKVRDLLFFFPRTYEDYRRIYRLDELAGLAAGSNVVVRGTVVRVHKLFRRMLDVYIEDGGIRLRARWFRPNAGMVAAYRRGETVALAGNLRVADDGFELIHPSNVTGRESEVGIRPRYSAIPGVPARTLEKIVRAAASLAAPAMPELLPDEVRARLGFPGIAVALSAVHCPSPELSEDALAALLAGSSAAQRRLVFEDLFLGQVGLLLERRRVRRQHAFVCHGDPALALATVRSALPFALTGGQEAAVKEIFDGLASTEPLQCLLQGDVGSGKTAVAFAAAARVGLAGGQSLLMAPTAVLAEQHFRTLRPLGEKAGLVVGLLHSGLPMAEQRQTLQAAEAGWAPTR